MTTYVNPFTGQTINPSSVSYESLTISANTALDWPINGTTGIPASNIIDVTATVAGLSLALPPASQVSTGQTVLIRNVGAQPFTVTGYTGTSVVYITSGVANYIYLTNNSTNAGVWSSTVLGASTSSSNAADLAGYGLLATGLTLNQNYPVTIYYSNYTLASTDRAKFAVWGSGAGTFTLPSAATVGAGWFCMIRNNGSGILTITPVGTDTIDGNATQQLQLTESLVIVSNGTNWNTFAYGRSNSFPYTLLSLNVTGGSLTLSSTQAANTIQEYGGTLASNQIIVLPSTVQLYTITNNTTGAYTFTVKTSVVGGATTTVAQSSTVVIICDGTNVYNASPVGGGGSSSFTSITLGNGSTSVPSMKFAGDANTGVYLPSTGQLGFVAGNALIAYVSSSGLTVTGAGAFSGAVSGSSGAFAGTVTGTAASFSTVSGTTGTFTTGISGGTF
jgi:hypothetical protein